ncbi:OPT oligopeptide transporter protein [Aquisphaera giovannonii]|uniref:OPT oligopeptide transporter protein n=2 Tax=Aquisphaera giovannonii TaxID=406548 RepID=A0A5B9WCF8_9BACT|nr:OPT oligopeptide transporter protein [Aquisphaera giovannonii]
MAASPPPTVAGEPKDAAFRPYVPAGAELAELSPKAVVLGSLLGVVFGASSLYLFLKVGMTVSASIPVAVLAITIFRGLSRAFGTRPTTILENNVVQTAGSAGESIAFGVGATMPALMLLGYELEWTRVMLVSVLGGLLGILMMIPLRKAFIVKQHKALPYPEGTACAKVLIVGEHGGSHAQTVFLGFGVGFVYQILMKGLKLWSSEWDRAITGIKGYTKAVVAMEPDPVLLGVGYIIGPRIAAVMVGGGLLTALMLTPMIAYFGEGLPGVLLPGQKPIHDMSAGEISGQYVRYIGAGAVAAGGILSMLNALPLIVSSVLGSFGALGTGRKAAEDGGEGDGTVEAPRTDRDIPMPLVFLGCIALVAVIAASNLIPTNPVGRVIGGAMVVVFGFLFVTVSSRITGVIGSSSNPISGMTIATLLLTCLIFVLLGWVGPEYRLAALSIAGVVCIASSNGGTTSQDLKTGYLVGATPWKQQVAILAGALVSAVVMGGILLWLNDAYSTVTDRAGDLPAVKADAAALKDTEAGPDGKAYKVWWVVNPEPGVLPGKYLVDEAGQARYLIDPGIGGRLNYSTTGADLKKFNPPQPRLFATIIDGIMKGDLPWGLVILGAVLAIVMQLAGVSALAFAVGVYLPLSTTLPIFVGGLIRLVVDRARRFNAEESDMSPGTMMSTGLIAGGSLAGIIIALLVVFEKAGQALDMSRKVGEEVQYLLPAIGAFAAIAATLLIVAMAGKRPVVEDAKDVEAIVTEI